MSDVQFIPLIAAVLFMFWAHALYMKFMFNSLRRNVTLDVIDFLMEQKASQQNEPQSELSEDVNPPRPRPTRAKVYYMHLVQKDHDDSDHSR